MSNGTAVRQCRLHLFSGPRAQTRVSIIAECANSSARAAQTESRRSIHATNPNAAGGRPRVTRLRREMYRWLDGRGRVFREHTPGTPNYLGKLDRRGPKGDDNSDTSDTLANDAGEGNADEGQGRGPKAKVSLTPFPANKVFRSQAVLSEELRDRIFEDVVVQGMDIATASAQYSVDVRRVAAVVRLKTIENNWVNEVCYSEHPPPFVLCDDPMYTTISLEDISHGYSIAIFLICLPRAHTICNIACTEQN